MFSWNDVADRMRTVVAQAFNFESHNQPRSDQAQEKPGASQKKFSPSDYVALEVAQPITAGYFNLITSIAANEFLEDQIDRLVADRRDVQNRSDRYAKEALRLGLELSIGYIARDVYKMVASSDPTGRPGIGVPHKDYWDPPVTGMNNIGTQGSPLVGKLRPDFVKEGGWLSTFLNKNFYGVSDVAIPHDYWQISVAKGLREFSPYNVAGMAITASFTAPALLWTPDRLLSNAIGFFDERPTVDQVGAPWN